MVLIIQVTPKTYIIIHDVLYVHGVQYSLFPVVVSLGLVYFYSVTIFSYFYLGSNLFGHGHLSIFVFIKLDFDNFISPFSCFAIEKNSNMSNRTMD